MTSQPTESKLATSAEPLPEGTLCPDCGYDLRGSTSARCPECGFGLDMLRTKESQIPWSRRQELGRVRAYWQTVWLAVRRPKRLCLEMIRPVSYGDAQRFRWITTALAFLALAIAVQLIAAVSDADTEDWIGIGVGLYALLFVVVLTPGAASCFFQSRRFSVEQQNRAVALSYYAWAPLAFLPVALVLVALAVAMSHFSLSDIPALACPICAFVVVLYIAVDTVCRITLFQQRLLQRSWSAALLRSLLLAPAALGIALASLLLPLGVYFLLVVWDSLH